MSAPGKRTLSLPAEQAACIESLITSGAYASGSDVERTGPRALPERDAAVERRLRHEVVPVYDAMQADPGRALPAKEVFDMIRGHHAKRLRTVARGA